MLKYLLKSYFWSVITIIFIIFVESTIMYYLDDLGEESTPFSSPIFISLISGVFFPIYNFVVLIILSKYRFTRIEVVVESFFFVSVLDNMDKLIQYFCSSDILLIPICSYEGIVYKRVWWYGTSMIIIYTICIAVIVCFVYLKIKSCFKKKKR
jgi:hypothetical protein